MGGIRTNLKGENMFYPQFKIDSKIQNAAAEVMKKITPRLQEIDEITE